MFMPAVRYDEKQIEKAITRIQEQFPEQIARIRFSIGEDWADYPAIFFRILLHDKYASDLTSPEPRRRFGDLLAQIMDAIKSEIDTDGLQPYFNFRTVSEQEQLRNPEWD